MAFASFQIYIGLLCFVLGPDGEEDVMTLFKAIGSASFAVILICALISYFAARSTYSRQAECVSEIAFCKKIALRWNPICAPFILLYYIAKRIPVFARFFADIAIATYAFTVSDGRIACAIGSSMGATIGYFVGSAIAGGLIGCSLSLLRKFQESRM